MNLNPIKANMTEVEMNGGLTVLFSYRTPVACIWTDGEGGRVLYKTAKRWSSTTTRHVNKWVAGNSHEIGQALSVISKPQEYFDSLTAKIK
jgi:hypothetical protein